MTDTAYLQMISIAILYWEVKNTKNMKTGKILSGISGEYFVAGELSRNGYVAALTLRNNADSDIITTTSDGTKSFNIQVKTKRKDLGILEARRENG